MILFTRKGSVITPTHEIMSFPFYSELIKQYPSDETILSILRYIYFVSHSESHIVEKRLPKAISIQQAKEASHLPNEVNVNSPVILDAIQAIENASKDIVKESINRVLASFDKTGKVIDKLLQEIDTLYETSDKDNLNKALGYLKSVMDLSSKIPEITTTLKTTLDAYKSKMDDKQYARGGNDIPDSYEGDSEIEGD